LVVLTSVEVRADSAPTKVRRAILEPFIGKYCIDCHGSRRQRGDTRFDTIHWEISDNESAQDWQDILDVLNSGEMPPEDEQQPKDDEFSKVVGILTEDLDKARKRLVETGGVYTIRRLNQREYVNTIQYLFGLNLDVSLLPDDVREEGLYDTAGSLQYLDGPLLEQYIRVGTEIAKEGFNWSARPYEEQKVVRFEAERAKGNDRNAAFSQSDKGYYLYRGDRKRKNISIQHGSDPRANYRFRFRAGVMDKSDSRRHFLTLSEASTVRSHQTDILSVLNVTGTVDTPSISEAIIQRKVLGPTTKPNLVIREPMPSGFTNTARWFPIYLELIGSERNKPNVWVDWLEVEGPIYKSKSNVFGDLIHSHKNDRNSPENVKSFLEQFSYEAFRRIKPSSKYIDKLVAYFELRISDGLKYEDAMGEAIGLILASPGFLYLEENQGSYSAKHLDERAFANRLAYFLWSAPPDKELYESAVSGELFKSAELREQVNRMLDDAKADSFYEGFMSQWADLDRLESISVEWKKFPYFNSGIRYSAYREPIEFFKVLVKGNLGVNNLIDSNFLTINSQLAHYYGVKADVGSSEFKKIPILNTNPRGGLITQSAFLAIGSAGDRTSPVIRGALILEKLLNNPPPPPPPNVPELGSASEKPLTNRQLVEIHREQKVCASCHDKIDPIGFGLENFDAVGLWRDTELVGKKQIPVESSAELVSGAKFNNLRELQVLLNAKKSDLARHMIDSLLEYAIGRPVEFSDEDDIEKALEFAESRKLAMRDLIFIVVNSRTFRSK